MNISVILLIIYHFKIGKKYKYQNKHIIVDFNFGLVGLRNLLHLTNKDVNNVLIHVKLFQVQWPTLTCLFNAGVKKTVCFLTFSSSAFSCSSEPLLFQGQSTPLNFLQLI